MKNSMLCLLPSKIAPRGRGVDNLLTRGDQMRRAVFIVVTVVGIIGASPAVASWERTILYPYGVPGTLVPRYYPRVEGGICGDTNPNAIPTEPLTCNGDDTSLYQIFIDPFRVYAATTYSVSQTIKVEADLYYYDSSSKSWALATIAPKKLAYSQPIPAFSNGSWTFGHPASDVIATCVLDLRKLQCYPAFFALPGGFYYTVVLTISWLNSSTGKVLAKASYLPGIDPLHDIGCAFYAEYVVGRCLPYVGSFGYLYFF